MPDVITSTENGIKELTVICDDEVLNSLDSTLKEDNLENESDGKMLLKKMRHNRIADIYAVRIFFVIFFAVFIIALIPSLRSTYSDAEKRELTKFPKFSVKALSSGSYFNDINLWFSDTFPFRDGLVKLNSCITGLFGKNTVQIHGDIEQGDAIPEIEDSASSETLVPETPTPEATPEALVPESPENAVPPENTPNTSGGESTPSASDTPVEHQPVVEQLSAVLLVDNTAYEYYTFNQVLADQYASHISRAGDMLVGRANVYDIIVPTSMGITAPANIAAVANSSDQKKAIEYMHSRISPSVNKVGIFDTLFSRKNEYIYFRTDHHWTGLGAYYAYGDFMIAKGGAPAPIGNFITRQFDGYLGSFYSASGQKPQLAATPDSVIAYEPLSGNTCTIYKRNGTVKTDASIISDGNALSQGSKYLSFIGGDNPLTIMENPMIESGVCIVVKESFGNAFVPFLTQNYRLVYVVDYRYFNERDPRKLSQLVTDTGANDVIFINNISATRSKMLVGYIGNFVG